MITLGRLLINPPELFYFSAILLCNLLVWLLQLRGRERSNVCVMNRERYRLTLARVLAWFYRREESG